MVGQLRCSGLEVRQNIMKEGPGGGKLLSSWQLGSQEGERVNVPPPGGPFSSQGINPSPRLIH